MAKNKVSEWSATASNNTDISGINISEGCAPSGINNAIRELMAQLKDMQAGTDGDNFSIGGNLAVTGTTTLTGTTAAPTPSTSDDSTKIATTAFVRDIIPSGVILMWSGSIATIPAGWVLCDGSNSTPDLRNRFIVGAGSTYSVAGTGGSADAIVVSHTHTGTTGAMNSNATHSHTYDGTNVPGGSGRGDRQGVIEGKTTSTANIDHTHNFTTGSTGSSGTNANLPPYYALAYIMKS